MRLLLSALAPLALLSACMAPAAPGNPDRVSLHGDTLAVHLYGGESCTADIKAAPSGRLAGCAGPLDYAVEVKHPTWVKGAEQILEPYATITLTRPSDGRRWVWQTPQPPGVGRDGISGGGVKLN
ncbi:MAG: hypothetical protein AB7U46_14925 [Paenirhodobacter sp.]|uniref:hypothetical protein n=1 Tax=Paenirhodobacter sp. TaxID=1965326 RepID=UPI003D0A6DF0